MFDLMIDIETLSTENNAAITQIGACYFDRETGEIEKEFLVNIDIEYYDSKEGKQFDISGKTLKWWFEQEEHTFLDYKKIETMFLPQALTELNSFARRADNIWSHASFDMPIITEAMSRNGLVPSWNYYKLRDIRTLKDLAGLNKSQMPTMKNKKTHNALDDCRFQVEYCTAYFKALKK